MSIHNYLLYSSSFFTDTPTTEIYTLSLHDALPILNMQLVEFLLEEGGYAIIKATSGEEALAITQNGLDSTPDLILMDIHLPGIDRKSTRLNSSHGYISYAVFCLKKKTKTIITNHIK